MALPQQLRIPRHQKGERQNFFALQRNRLPGNLQSRPIFPFCLRSSDHRASRNHSGRPKGQQLGISRPNADTVKTSLFHLATSSANRLCIPKVAQINFPDIRQLSQALQTAGYFKSL